MAAMTRRTVVVLFGLALAVRLAFLLFLSMRYPVRLDGSELGAVAQNIAAGRGFSSPFGPGDSPTAHFGPVVPYIWAAVFSITGAATSASANVIRGLQAIASALAVVLYALAADRVRRRWPVLPPATPVMIGLVMAFWPESILRLTNTWYNHWQEAGLALMVFLGMVWIDRPSYRTAIAVGASAGLLALINPSPAIVLAPILATPLFAAGSTGLRALRPAVAGGLVALLLVIPWTVRNYVVFGEVIPIRGNMNLELLQAHHPDASPLQHHASFHPVINRQARALYDSLGEREFMAWAGREARRHVRENPGPSLEMTARRVGLFWVTNALDAYRWNPDMPRWWRRCCGFEKAQRLATVLCAFLSVGVALGALVTGRFRPLPYQAVFLGIVLLLPLPYYLTAPFDTKSMLVRSWLAMLGTIAILSARSARTVATPDE